MYNEREITHAIEQVFDMFDEETMDFLTNNYEEEMALPFDSLAQAVRDNAMTVYEYRAVCAAGDCMDYHGNELFDQRATFILSNIDAFVESDRFEVDYRTELWLLEDMSFAVVHAVIVMVKDGEKCDCITEYRSFVKILEDEADMFFEPEDFISQLDDLATFYEAENLATIYEM